MLAPLLTALLATAAPASAAADPELEIFAQSLVPSERAAVEKAAPLASLPRYRADVDLDYEHRRLRVTEQIVYPVTTPEPLGELFYRIPANAPFNDQGQGRAVRTVSFRRGADTLKPEGLDTGVYRVVLNPPAEPGSTLTLEVKLDATVPSSHSDNASGEAQLAAQMMKLLTGGATDSDPRTDYGAFSCGPDACLLAGSLVEVAPRSGLTFDARGEVGVGEPRWGGLGNWVVSVVAPPAVTVAGTGAQIGREATADGRVRTTRVAAAVRSFGLAASDHFQVEEARVGPVTVRAYAPAEHAPQMKKLLASAVAALGFYGQRLTPYPWTELAVVAAPVADTEALAWPNLVAASSLLYDARTQRYMDDSDGQRSRTHEAVLELNVAHQVAHNWWGGVVGSDLAAQPALSEPIAVYSAMLAYENHRGASGRQAAEHTVLSSYFLARLFGGPDRVVARTLEAYPSKLEVDAYLRGKGPLMYRALRKKAGDAALWAALRSAVVAHRFATVETDPVLLALSGGKPGSADALLKIYDRFMHQTRGDEDLGRPPSMGDLMQGAASQGSVNRDQYQLMQQLLQAAGALGGAGADSPPPAPKKKTK